MTQINQTLKCVFIREHVNRVYQPRSLIKKDLKDLWKVERFRTAYWTLVQSINQCFNSRKSSIMWE